MKKGVLKTKDNRRRKTLEKIKIEIKKGKARSSDDYKISIHTFIVYFVEL